MAAPPIGLTLTTTCRQRCLRRRHRCDWAKNRKRWLLTARANRKHSKAAVCGEHSSAQCTQTTYTVCTKRSAECVPSCTTAIGELTKRRGPKLGASPLKGHTTRRQRPSQGYTHSHRGFQWGLHIFSHYRTGGNPAQRAHTRRHGEVLTTVAGAHNLTKVVVAGGTHKCATAIAATVTTRCPSQQCAADISYFRCLAYSTALFFSPSLYLFIFVCVFLSSVLYVHCTCFVLCELWLGPQWRSLHILCIDMVFKNNIWS